MQFLFSVMKKLWKSAVCAVGKFRYYCEVKCDYPGRASGVYTFSTDDNKFTTRDYDIIRRSHIVWRQGPRGGVKITKDWGAYGGRFGYVTNNKKQMEKFMWIKLQSEELS